MRRVTMLLAALIAIAPAARAQPIDLSRVTMVDLTHAFDSGTLYWPTSPSAFALERLSFGETEGGYFYSSNAFSAPEHGGTQTELSAGSRAAHAPRRFHSLGSRLDRPYGRF